MCYSIIDVENEIMELGRFTGRCDLVSTEAMCWRLEQMLREVSIGSKLRNVRILSAIHRIKMAIEPISDSKNKNSLEIIIQNKKEEIKKFESQDQKLTLN